MAAPTTAPARDPRSGTVVHRLFRGFAYPFRALGLMFKHPRLWTYALVQIGVSIVLLSVLFVVLVYQGGNLTGLIWHRPDHWYTEIFWYGLYVIVFFGTFVIGALTLPALIASPFNDALSERTETILLGGVETPKMTMGRLFRDIGRVLVDQSIRIALLLAGHLVILVLLLIPVAGQFAYPIVATTWSIIWVASDYIDYPMGRNGYRFRLQRQTITANLGLCFGFGGGVYLFLLIPFLNILFVPVAVVGGTMLYADFRRVKVLPAPPKR